MMIFLNMGLSDINPTISKIVFSCIKSSLLIIGWIWVIQGAVPKSQCSEKKKEGKEGNKI